MATYAIGDIQGCFDELKELLDKIQFDPNQDQIWLTGDLVNRGPKSLETLRFIRDLGDSAVTVLGNHDLHLLAVAHGVSRTKHHDTFIDVIEAPDRDELLEWLRHRPLLHVQDGFHLIHAGLPRQWSAEEAIQYAREAETVLQGPNFKEFLWHMYGNHPSFWDESLTGWDRIRFITNCFTRMRYSTQEGELNFTEKGKPGSQPEGLMPWFSVPNRLSRPIKILFGHWSTLGYSNEDNSYCLDTGCLWGGQLTALKLGATCTQIAIDSHRPDPFTPVSD